ncbi:MAG: hypothetical protein IT327_12250 [Anaerolineae bacterium]|nr:hypothetical protein [Anaerolineae bacterium]
MARSRKEKERKVIAEFPNRRPYGAKLALLLEKQTSFRIDGECTFLVSPDIHLRIKPKHFKQEGGYGWEVIVDGFATASEAEQMGLKVALGLLWTAIQGRYSAKLIYHTPLPCVVYDRQQSKGVTLSGEATLSVIRGPERLVSSLDQVLSSQTPVDSRLLVAVEIFASAKLESTERTKFVGLVSALEPIAVQKRYDDENLNSLLKNFIDDLNNSDLDSTIKSSLTGRINQLRFESVSRAIKRLVEETLPEDSEAVSIVQEAYDLRSKILHDGSTDADLQEKSRDVEEIVRKILETKIKTEMGIVS